MSYAPLLTAKFAKKTQRKAEEIFVNSAPPLGALRLKVFDVSCEAEMNEKPKPQFRWKESLHGFG